MPIMHISTKFRLDLISMLFFLVTSLHAIAPDIENFLRRQSPFTFKISGFARSDVFMDTRQALSFRENIMLFAPREPCILHGGDVNSVGTFNITPLRSFLRLDAHDAISNGKKIQATIQLDFLGANEDTLSAVRVWYAYFEIKGRRDKVVIGQLRHPLRLLQVYPRALTFNVAEILAVPQIRWVHHFTERTHLLAAIHSEFLECSWGQITPGINVDSPQFLQNSMKPAFAVRLQYEHEKYIVGAGYDVRSIVPRLVTLTGYSTSQEIAASWITAFAGFTSRNFLLRWQSLVGQNTTPANLLGGAALSSCFSPSNQCTYTNLWAATHWLDFEVTRHPVVHPGFFLGYSPVFHVDKQLYFDPTTHKPVIFTFNDRLQTVLRVAGRLTGEWEPVKVGMEYIYAFAQYGDRNAGGQIINPVNVSMGRLLFVMWVYF